MFIINVEHEQLSVNINYWEKYEKNRNTKLTIYDSFVIVDNWWIISAEWFEFDSRVHGSIVVVLRISVVEQLGVVVERQTPVVWK